MPRKTREQKILAELRTLRNQVSLPPTHVSLENNQRQAVSRERLTNLMSSSQLGATTIQNYDYVFRDLRKVALLAAIALLIEIVLSLTLNIGFAKLIPGLH